MKKAFIKLHVVILLAGFTGIFGKLITLNEGLLVWYRISLAGILLAGILAVSKRLKPVSLKEFSRLAGAGFLLALHWVFFYGSIKYANVSVGVICFSLTGFFTALLAPLLNRQKFVVSELLLSLLTLLGITLIFSLDTQYRLGIMLGVVSAMLATLYTFSNERLGKAFSSEIFTTYSMLGGALCLSLVMPLYLFFFPVASIMPSWSDLVYLLLLAFFCTVVLYMLYTQALNQISAFTVNLSLNLEPVYAIIMAILLFHENRELTPVFYLGVSFIVLSVVLQMMRVLRSGKKALVTPG